MNTTDFLTIAAAICPERDCIVFEGKRQTYSQTNERVSRLANSLAGMGMAKGDRMAVLQVNTPQYIESYFAAAKLGAIMVPMNFRGKPDELSYIMGHAEARFVMVGNRYLDMVRGLVPGLPSVKHVVTMDSKVPDLPHIEDLVAAGSPDEVFTEIGDDDVTILVYTAGTTGRPKGVPLRHAGFAAYVLENVEPASPDLEEKNLLTVPFNHVAGLQAMLAAIYGGRTLVLMRQFDTKEWLDTVQREQASRAMLVPTMLKWIIEYPEFSKYNMKSLRVLTYGAAPMPFEVIMKAIEVMPWVKFINAFGQTETASTITTLGPEDHVIEGTKEERELKLKRLSSSIGRPLPDVEVRVVDEEGREVPRGEVGEIVARGPRVMSGYWQDEKKTAQVMTPDGWLRTNDMGYMDKDGYIYLAGRKDDMIKRGGELISPEEVEDVICACPPVDEAAVVGIPDVEWGQEVVCFCVLKPGQSATEKEIIDYAHPKLGFKKPKCVVFMNELPRNPMGKVLKRVLREQYQKK